MERRWGRVAEAAEILGVHPQTVRKIADAGNIPVRQLPGVAHKLFDLAAVERLAEESTRPATAGV